MVLLLRHQCNLVNCQNALCFAFSFHKFHGESCDLVFETESGEYGGRGVAGMLGL